jgi:hypothetical protein
MDKDDAGHRVLATRIDALEKISEERWASHLRVHEVAEQNVNRRLDEMNQLRQQINNERGSYVTRATDEARQEAQRKTIEGLSKLVWLGMGLVLAISFGVNLFLSYFHR